MTGEKVIPPQYMSIQPPTENLDDGLTPVVYMDYTPENKALTISEPDKYMSVFQRKLLPSSVLMSGHNTSIYKQLGELGKSMMNGPYKMSGRDNKLALKNSSANKKTIASYTYAGGHGELIDFEVETEFSTSTVEVTKNSSIDPDDKMLHTTTVQAVANTDAMYVDGRIKWYKRSDYGKNLIIPADATRVATVIPMPFLAKQDGAASKADWEVKNENAYDDVSKAKQDIGSNYQISDYDTETYWNDLSNKFNSVKAPETVEELNTMLRELNTLSPYVIKKKIQIRDRVSPISYSSPRKTIATSVYGYHQQPTYHQARAEQINRWKEGYSHLEQDPTITIIPKVEGRGRGGYTVGEDMVDILQEKEVEIPIPGARILSSANFKSSDVVIGNDLVKTTQAKITAKGKVLGRPSLEEGMNIEIKNISSRYSGVWHTKKVRHELDNGGYFCSIEFIQKTLPISKNTISAKVNTQKAFAAINGIAKESLKTKSYNIPSELSKAFLEWRKDNGEEDANYLIQQDANNPRKARVYKAGSDFQPGRVEAYSNTNQVGTIELPEDEAITENETE